MSPDPASSAPQELQPLEVPADGLIRVAVLLDQQATVIDFAGPWEAFQDAVVAGDSGFVLYTVAESRDPLKTSGFAPAIDAEGRATYRPGGFTIQPDFTFEDAPQPNVLVMGAQANHSEAKRAWIRRVAVETDVVLSICTGAFLLARTGLLDGLAATTHHDFFDAFEREFPAVRLVRDTRYVDNGQIVTAGGLTSGIDGALHIVARYFGADVARATAAIMEHMPTPRTT